MGLFSRFRKKENRNVGHYSSALPFGSLFGGSVGVSASMQLSPVYRAINLISNSCAILPISLFADGKRISNGLSYLVNNEPNAIHTRFILVKMLVCDMLRYGNAYVWIHRSGFDSENPDNSTGDIVELRYMPGSDMQVLFNLQSYEKRFHSISLGRDFEDWEIIHLMNYSENGIFGLSVLQAAARTLKIAQASERTAENYFDKGGAVTGILASKSPLNAKQKQETRTSWNEIMACDNGGVVILGNDMTFTPISSNAADAQLLESRQFNVEEIARFFDVSPTMLGDLTKSSYATFEATTLDFLTNCLQPRLTNMEQELTKKLLLKREKIAMKMHFAFETEDLLRCTKTEMAQYYNTMIQNGIMSVNEVRSKLDFEPVDGGDEHYIQLNMATLTQAAANPENNE